ncbi:MAG TPA: DUF3106 domain-containing protein, partial [Candidatus Aquicultoraceae bacterium]|nr:DUF3106 domain-containing protein [Candidatus Aquicultoraceae bacterium]
MVRSRPERRVPAVVLAIFLAAAVLPLRQAEASGRRGEDRGARIGAARGDGGGRPAPAGDVTPEKVERWRKMTPGERDRIRERYRRWKELPPERR